MDCSPPGASVHEIFQARILEWVAISFSRASSWPRDGMQVSWLAGEFFTTEPLGKPPVEWCVSFTLGFRGVDAFSGKELGKDSPGRTSSMNKGPQHGSAALARKALNTHGAPQSRGFHPICHPSLLFPGIQKCGSEVSSGNSRAPRTIRAFQISQYWKLKYWHGSRRWQTACHLRETATAQFSPVGGKWEQSDLGTFQRS